MFEQAAAAADLPDNPFAALARERTAQGLSLEDVAQHLKFAPRQIEALEAGDFDRLPAGTFARGMLRGYARLLKLDAEAMLAALGESASAARLPEKAVVLPDPVPFADGARRTNVSYLAVSIGMLVVVAVLAFEWMRDGGSAAKLAFVPAAQTPPAAQAQTPPSPQTMVSSIAPTPAIAVADPAAPAAAAAETPRAAGARRISLSFARESWVQIVDREGRTLLSQLNPAGSEQAVEGTPPFDVVVGNAQHVRMNYDDRPIDLMPHVKVEVARFTLE